MYSVQHKTDPLKLLKMLTILHDQGITFLPHTVNVGIFSVRTIYYRSGYWAQEIKVYLLRLMLAAQTMGPRMSAVWQW